MERRLVFNPVTKEFVWRYLPSIVPEPVRDGRGRYLDLSKYRNLRK